VHRAGPADAARVRALRLLALADTPDAFWATLEEERLRPVEAWRAALADPAAATFLAVRSGVDVGLVVGRARTDVVGDAGLYAMWVAPSARRSGVGHALIGATLAWARDAGFTRVRLFVTDANAAAVATYAAHGFVATGRTGTLQPPREHITEHELAIDLTAPTRR
jgi:GNAT superfamily N-acetyltransferase